MESNLKLSSFFIAEYKRLESWAKRHHIRIFLTYPATAENPQFSLNDTKTFAKIDNLKTALKSAGIEIYGDFRDFHFMPQYFYDTTYHLNHEGAKLRSKNFVKMLENMEAMKIL